MAIPHLLPHCHSGEGMGAGGKIVFWNKSGSHSLVSDSLRPHRLYSPWNFLGQNTGVGSRSLLQGIFPTWGSNWGFLHCRQILYHLNYQGSPWYKCMREFLNVYRGAWGGFLVSSTLDLMKTIRFIGHKVCYLHSLQL